MKMLVVDDDHEIVSALKCFFSTKGCEVVGAFSGEEALGILEKEHTDLILLDIMMPGIKGAEVARIVKEKYPFIKLIVVTGYPEQGKRILRDVNLDGLFIKPIGIQDLYSKVAAAFSHDTAGALPSEPKQGIKAMVLLIKARLLFVEPSPEAFSSLKTHFEAFSARGEDYELEAARDIGGFTEKMALFKPDMLVVNMSYLGKTDKDFMEKMYKLPHRPKETIIYAISEQGVLGRDELDRLTKTIQIFALRNGLLEIKWVDI